MCTPQQTNILPRDHMNAKQATNKSDVLLLLNEQYSKWHIWACVYHISADI